MDFCSLSVDGTDEKVRGKVNKTTINKHVYGKRLANCGLGVMEKIKDKLLSYFYPSSQSLPSTPEKDGELQEAEGDEGSLEEVEMEDDDGKLEGQAELEVEADEVGEVTLEEVEMEDDGGLEEPGIEGEAVHIQEVIPKELDVEQLQQTVIAVGREAALAYVRGVILATEVEAAHIQEVIRDLEGEEGDKSEGLRGVEDDGPRESESEVEDDKSEEPRGMEAEDDRPRVSEVEDDGPEKLEDEDKLELEVTGPVGTGKSAMEDDSKLEGPGELGMEVGGKLIVTGESELSEVEDHSKVEGRERTDVEDDDKLEKPAEFEVKVGDKMEGSEDLEVETVKVQLREQGCQGSTQSCKLCGASFPSELGLLLHFHKEHITPQQNMDETGESADLTFFGESESDLDAETEEENESNNEGEPDTGGVNFLSKWEMFLLQEPLFPPFTESEEESEDDEDNVGEAFEFQDFSCAFRFANDSLEIDEGADQDHENPSKDLDLDSSMPSPSNESSSTTPSKRSLPKRTCKLKTSPSSVSSSSISDKRKRTLRLLPLLRSPMKTHHENNPKDGMVKSSPTVPSPDIPCQRPVSSTPKKVVDNDHAVIHSLEKGFECEICKLRFYRRNELTRHTLQHNGKKSHRCNICSREFARADYLQLHMDTHTQKKRFECEYCKKGFSRKNDLKRHKTLHNGEKRYKCDICNHRFVRQDHLQRHVNTHKKETPFECDHCERRFSVESNKNRHIRQSHPGTLPYNCEHCKKGFIRPDNLRFHIEAVHYSKQIVPFSCQLCQEKFTARDDLLIHKKKGCRNKRRKSTKIEI